MLSAQKLLSLASNEQKSVCEKYTSSAQRTSHSNEDHVINNVLNVPIAHGITQNEASAKQHMAK